MIEAALLTILLDASGVTDIVDHRIYLSVIPQYSEDDSTTESPCIVIFRTGTNYEDTECEGEEPSVDLEVVLIADSYTQLAALKAAVESELRDTYNGSGTTMITAGGSPYYIDAIELQNFRTEWTAQIEGNSKGLFRGLIEINIRYET